jgi:hypothetical protein
MRKFNSPEEQPKVLLLYKIIFKESGKILRISTMQLTTYYTGSYPFGFYPTDLYLPTYS